MSNTTHTPIIMQSRRARAPLPLVAPDIAVAFHDEDSLGLIPISELNAPLTADFVVWEAAEEGYTYQLYWDNNHTGPIKVIQETELPGDPLTLEIPLDLLTEGTHTLAYSTYSPASNTYIESAAFPVIIDRTAPGKPELSAIHFPVEVSNGLTAAELAQLGNKLQVEIAGYTEMKKHDTIQTFWGDIEGPAPIVDADDMGLNKVIFDFSGAFLESIPPGPHAVKYRVTDRAGNISDYSLSVEILLLLEEIPDTFPAPVIDPVVGTLIDYAEAKPGVTVDIPHYPGAAAFDQITLSWGAGQPMQPVSLPAGNEDEDVVLSLRVPFETIALVPVGNVVLTYSVTRQNQLYGTSQSSAVDVFITLPVPEPSQPLIVQGTSLTNPNLTDNFIDEDDYELNSRGIVEWSDEFKVNDDINLFWGEQQKTQWYQIKAEDIAARIDLIIPIANSIMKAQGTGAEIPAYYSVVRQGNPNATKAPTQPVTVRSKENLPGGPDGIDGPAFKLNPAGFISPPLNPNGADGHIAPYLNIAENQKLFITFKGFDRNHNPIDAADFTDSRELDDKDVINGYTFRVPHTILRTICRGFCEAYFRIEPAPGSNHSAVTSAVTSVPVEMRTPDELTCSI